jgi:hypothetical protein
VDQQAGDDAMPGLRQGRPWHPRDPDNQAMEDNHEAHPGRQEGERLGIGHAVFGADKAGAPQENKQHWRRGHGGVTQIRSQFQAWLYLGWRSAARISDI